MTGLTIYNDSGTLQIDEDYKNLSLVEKPIVNAVGGSGLISINYTGVRPVVAVGHTTFVAFVYATVSGTSWTFYFMGGGAAGTPIQFYIFDDPKTAPTFGLEVYNAAGQLSFSFGAPPLRIVSIHPNLNPTVTQSFSLSAGKTYATVLARPGRQMNNSVGSLEFVHYLGGRQVAGGIETGPVSELRAGPGGTYTFLTTGAIAAIDVTGY